MRKSGAIVNIAFLYIAVARVPVTLWNDIMHPYSDFIELKCIICMYDADVRKG